MNSPRRPTPVILLTMQSNHERTGAVAEHRSISERRMPVLHTTSMMAQGRPTRRAVFPEYSLRDEVRNLRMALSDLTTQVSDLAAALGRG